METDFVQPNLYDEFKQLFHGSLNVAKISVLLPTGLVGLTSGIAFPDVDISLLGIGKHRFFLFHSAIGLSFLKVFYHRWLEKEEGTTTWGVMKKKIAGTLLGSFALGVGIHLAIDVFQPKAVIFPLFGSIADGT